MRIKFDARYREQIESGEYKVVYGPNELPVTVLDWNYRGGDYKILIKVEMKKTDVIDFINASGNSVSRIPVGLIVPDQQAELSQFQVNVLEVLKQVCSANLPSDSPMLEKMAVEYGNSLLEVAREQLQPEIDKELDNAYKNRDEVVYRQGFNEALSLMCWKKIDSDKYDGEDIPLSIVRSTDVDGDYRYHFGTFVYPQQEYIPIADLEKLKPQKFEAQ